MTDTPTPITPAAPVKRGPGRPKGSRTKPKPKPTAPTSVAPAAPDNVTVPADDAAAQSIADKLAAAATPSPKPNDVGRPSARQSALSQLAEQLAVAYTAAGGMIAVAGSALTLSPSTRSVGLRLSAVGGELERNADACGLALARWADTNPKVKAWLSRMSTGSGALMVIAAHAPILAAAFGQPPELGDVAAAMMGSSGPADGDTGAADVSAFLSGFASMMFGETSPPTVPVAPVAPDPVVAG